MLINAYVRKVEPTRVFSYEHANIHVYADLWSVFDRNVPITFSEGKIISFSNLTVEAYPGLKLDAQIDLLSLPGGIRRQLEKMTFINHLTSLGLKRKSDSQVFFPKGSGLTPKQFGSAFINPYVTIELNWIGHELLVTVDPSQTVTPDGINWDLDFARDNFAILSRNPLSYRDFIKTIDAVFELLGDSFDIATDCGNYSYKKADVLESGVIRNTGYEPKVSFGPGKNHTFPAAGIKQFGPWDYNLSEERPREIRVGIIGENFSIPLLRQVYAGETGKQYPFPGFHKVYKSKLVHDQEKGRLEVTEAELKACSGYEEIGAIFREKARQLSLTCDVAIIALPDFLQDIPEMNLRDFLKVVFWEEKLATQIILNNTVQRNENLIVDNLALGIYVAAGGKPWVLEDPLENNVCVGISFGISKDKHTLVGIVEIFDGYGLSLAMDVSEIITIPDREIKHRDMHLSTEQLSEIIRKAINRFSEQYDGNHPERVLIHKTTYYNSDELRAITTLPEFNVEMAFVYVNSYGNGLNLIKESRNASPPRLTYWVCDDNKALLYTKGPDDRGRTIDPFLPQPLWIEVQAVSDGKGYSIDQACKDVVKLTKLNWNSVVSYEREPATISRSRKIVDLLRVGLSMGNIPTDIRFFL